MIHDDLWITTYPYAPWCWNIYLHFPLSKITQFCRFLYTSTMVRIWVMLGYKLFWLVVYLPLWVSNDLVGAITILKNDGVRQWEG